MAVITQAQIDDLKAGINQALTQIESAFALQVLAEKFPIFGDELKNAFDTANPALRNIETIRNYVDSALSTFTGSPDYLDTDIESQINAVLGSFGSVDAIVGGPTDVQFVFSTSKSYSYTQAIESNLGLPGLNLQTTGSANAGLAYTFNFTAGVDSTGFFVNTAAANELQVSVTAGLPGFSADTNLGFLHFAAADGAVPTSLTGNLTIDLKDANSDGKLRLSELASDVLDATFSGSANVNLHLTGDMSTAVLPSVSADLGVAWSFSNSTVNPGDSNASFGNAPTVAFTNVTMNFGTFVENYITPILDKLDPILDPINDAIAVFRTPLTFLENLPGAGLLDVAGADNGSGGDAADGHITMLDFIRLGMNASGNSGTSLVPAVEFINLVDDIVDWAAFFQGKDFGPDQFTVGALDYSLGGFDFSGIDIRNPGFTMSAVDLGAVSVTQAANLGTFFSGLSGYDYGTVDPGTGQTGKDILNEMVNGQNFAFPILENPLEVFKLLLGQQADLFNLDLPELNLGFGSIDVNGNFTGGGVTLAEIPVFPGINVYLKGAMNVVMDLAFGFDTRGLEQFVSSGFTNFASVFNGFYIDDQFVGGIDKPEITLEAALALGAEATIYVASLGANGNVSAQVFFNLNDNVGTSIDGDYRVYLDELGNALVNNPFEIFDTSGRVTAGFTGYATVLGYDLWRYNSPRLTLANFGDNPQASGSGGPPPPPPGLGDDLGGGVLRLNIGPNAGERDISDITDDGETLEVQFGAGNTSLVGFGRSQSFPGITGITGDGGAGDDQIILGATVNASATLSGGVGEDFIRGGANSDVISGNDDRDNLEGKGGQDSLYGGEGNDVLEGGDGGDLLDGGNGFDVVSYANADSPVVINLADNTGASNGGDALGDTLVGVEMVEGSELRMSGMTVLNSGNDTITGSSSGDILFGLSGDDVINGGDGGDVIVGGAGADNIDGGDSYDSASYYSSPGGVTVNLTDNNLNAGADAAGDTLTNIEQLEGSYYNDMLVGDAGNNYLIGGNGADTLDGGDGFDTAWYISAPTGVTVSMLTTAGSTSHGAGDVLSNIERIEGSDFSDNLSGDNLDNELLGGKGSDTLIGNDGEDYLLGDELNTVAPGDDRLFGGDGNDTLVGGLGADSLVGDGGFDTATYLGSNGSVNINLATNVNTGGHAQGDTLTGVEMIIGSTLGDIIEGDGGNNVFFGDLGGDSLVGNGGNDSLVGNGGNDTLEGGDLSDTLIGGLGADVLDGGNGIDLADYSVSGLGVSVDLANGVGGGVGSDAEGDVLSTIENVYGSDHNDTITGDSQVNVLDGRFGNDSISAGAGNDTVTGSVGLDTLDGGLGNDLLSGGVDNDSLFGGDDDDSLDGGSENDYVDGGNGNDTLVGGLGADTLDGGLGIDVATYGGSAVGVNVSLTALEGIGGNPAQNEGEGDIFAASGFSTVENLEGSIYADRLEGDGQNNDLSGLAGNDSLIGLDGNDTIRPGDGADSIDGGTGRDVLSYIASSTGVTIDLTTGLGSGVGRQSEGDVIALVSPGVSSIEDLQGSNFSDVLTGDTQNNLILGEGGSDALSGQGGADTLMGGSGNDTLDADALNAATGADMMFGESGNDVYWIDDHGDRVFESAGADIDDIHTFFTTDLSDSGAEWGNLTTFENLYLEGSANLDGSGHGGNNILSGNSGDNILLGNGGSDTISGNDGDDFIDGGFGNDTAGDILDGGAGSDTVDYSYSTQAIHVDLTVQLAESRAAALDPNKGSAFGDTIANFENVLGTIYSDSLVGNGDDNYLHVWRGSDTASGGAGTDVLAIDWTDVTANRGVVYSSYNQGTGTGAFDSFHSSIGTTAAVSYSGFERFDLTGTTVGDNLRGGDLLLGDTLIGGGGDDSIDSYGGVDIIDGGAGNDLLNLANFTYATVDLDMDNRDGIITFLDGTSILNIEAFQNLTTGIGNDVVRLTGNFNDSATLGGGNDLVDIGLGKDTMTGGLGDDTLVFDWTSVTANRGVAYSAYNQGAGSGTLDIFHSSIGTTASLIYDGFEHFQLTGTVVGDNLRGGPLADTLSGGDGDDAIEGYGGVDIIDGGTGNDLLNHANFASATADLDMDNRDGLITFLDGTSITNIEIFQDLTTGTGNDVVRLIGNFNDSAVLGDGNDLVDIGLGKDTMTGGLGDDTLVFDWTTVTANRGVAYSAYNQVAGSGTLDLFHSSIGTTASLIYDGFEHFQLTGTIVADNLRGGPLADTLNGGDGDDAIEGYGGVDIIDGGAGNDLLNHGNFSDATANLDMDNRDGLITFPDGTSITSIEIFQDLTTGIGNDTVRLTGNFNDSANLGDGNDLVDIGLGKDTMTGGLGDDTLVFDWTTVTANRGVVYSAYNQGAGSGTLDVFHSSFGPTASVIYDGFEHFNLTGTIVADNLRGGPLADTLNGGDGDDAIESFGGVDIIDGGTGNDLLNHANFSSATADLDMDNRDGIVSFLDGTSITNIEIFQDLTTGIGNDTVRLAGNFNDSANLGDGNDLVDIGQGKDTMTGGAGDDTLVFDWTGVTANRGVVYSVYTQGTGSGTLDVFHSSFGPTASLNYDGFEHFNLTGTIVADNLRGGLDSDTLVGGLGNDSLQSFSGADSIDGGAGVDSLYDADYSAATLGLLITNPAGLNSLANGASIDGIERFERLTTGSGNDVVILSGGHNDTVTLGAGDDLVNVGEGLDVVRGGADSDTLKMDWTGVTVNRGVVYSQYDQLAGSGVFDTFHSSFGTTARVDYAEFEHFDLTGSTFGDDLRGGSNADTLAGGLGNDVLRGYGGFDSLVGGDGNDLLTDGDFSALTTSVTLSGGAFNDFGDGTIIDTIENFQGLVLGTGNDAVHLSGSFNDSVTLGDGNDLIDVGQGADTATGGAGDDTLVFDWSAVTANRGVQYQAHDPGTGSGAFNVFHSSIGTTSSLSYGGFEHFNFTGTVSGDNLRGGTLSDTLIGGDGDDALESFGGADSLVGGLGIDSLYDANFTTATQDLLIINPAGANTLANGAFIDGIERYERLTTGSGNDVVILSGSYNDSVTLGGGDDLIDIGRGSDTVRGGADSDTLTVDWSGVNVTRGFQYGSFDSVTGGGVIDTFHSSIGTTSRVDYGEFEHFNMTGTTLGDDLRGGIDSDTLSGGTGDDVLRGYGGLDSLSGGDGNDLLTDGNFASLTSGVTILGGAHNDFGNGTVIDTIEYFQGLVLGTGNDDVRLSGVFNDSVTLGDGDDVIDVGRGADTVAGGAGTDTLIVDWSLVPVTSGVSYSSYNSTTGDGTFSTFHSSIGTTASLTYSGFERFNLTGTAAGDHLRGGALADTLIGGLGNDVIESRGGADSIDGGDGSDELTNADFSGASADLDLDNLDGIISFADGTSITGIERFTNLSTGSGNDVVRLAGSFSDSVNLGGGHDLIDVGQGFDTVVGGTGNDTLVMDWTAVPANQGVRYSTYDAVAGSGAFNAFHSSIGTTATVTYSEFEHFNLTGTATGDDLRGGAQADTLSGGAGNDTMAGGDGNDTYYVDSVNDVVTENINEGTDTVYSAISYTLTGDIENLVLTGSGNIDGTGSAVNNSLTGNIGNNILDGGAGDDTMTGGDGDDTYYVDSLGDVVVEGSNGGNDTVISSVAFNLVSTLENLILTGAALAATGNAEANILTGNAGANTLSGGLGADTLDGGTGIDSLVGGEDDDTYVVDNVNDVIVEQANEGTDTVQSSGNFVLQANFENLTLTGTENLSGTGSADDNAIAGNSGDNALDGAGGDDTLAGHEGDDTYFVDSLNDVLVEAFNEGNDSVNSSVNWTLGDNFENLTLTGSAISGTGNSVANALTGNGGNNQLTGNAGNDTLDGGAGTDTLTGGDDNDTYIVDSTSDVVVENNNEGTDTVLASASFTLSADVENLTLTGTGSINATGNTGDNMLTGNTGDNVLDGGDGTDTLDGGDGNDTYVIDSLTDVISDTSGTDTISASVNVSLANYNGIENITLTGTATTATGDDSGNVITGNAEDNVLNGGDGNDTLSGLAGADTLDGSLGDDSMLGGDGDDRYLVDSAGDVVNESGTGTDEVQSAVDYTLTANVENLILLGTAASGTGNASANIITGNAQDNTLTGGAGNDTLVGDLGADSLVGGADNDTYVVDSASDIIVEQTNEGTDTVRSSVSLTLGLNLENLTLLGTATSGTGNAANNTLIGNNLANTLSGGAGDDTLEGLDGNDLYIVDSANDVIIETVNGGIDTVRAFAGFILPANVENLELFDPGTSGTGNALDNALTGNALNNALTSGLGNDTLDGLGGTDTLTGGDGNDVYFVDNTADQVVELANEGSDRIESSADFVLGANIEELKLTGTAVNATGNDSDNILIGNATANLMLGLAGNDTLTSNGGADTLDGGLGNDTYVVDSVTGLKFVENTNAGTDEVQAGADLILAKNFENLVLTGTAIKGTGNTAANVLTGNASANQLLGMSGNDTLDGLGGADTLEGGSGNDTFIVDGTDTVKDSGGVDTIVSSQSVALTSLTFIENATLTGAALTATGNKAANRLTGNGLNNTLEGAAGNDTLEGGAGIDSLTGGLGNDTYVVDSATDVITEAAKGGADLVLSSADFTLGAEVENLTLTGTAANATGNAAANKIIGNASNNRLDGGAGIDVLTGGFGDDIYVLDTVKDKAVEKPNSGHDRAEVSADKYVLAVNLEDLTLTGTAVTATGNASANVMQGNAQSNTLKGLAGDDTLIGANETTFGVGEKDTLTGGKGADHFVLGTSLGRFYDDGNAGANGLADYAYITDFSAVQGDRLQLFGAAADYVLGTSPIAGAAGTGIFHDTNTNGTLDAGTDELIAVIKGATPINLGTSADFVS